MKVLFILALLCSFELSKVTGDWMAKYFSILYCINQGSETYGPQPDVALLMTALSSAHKKKDLCTQDFRGDDFFHIEITTFLRQKPRNQSQ